MKTTWVLSEEERIKFKERSKKRNRSTEDERINSGAESLSLRNTCSINEEEMLEVNDLVKLSGYFDTSKVNDMETSLIRDIIRLTASSLLLLLLLF